MIWALCIKYCTKNVIVKYFNVTLYFNEMFSADINHGNPGAF